MFRSLIPIVTALLVGVLVPRAVWSQEFILSAPPAADEQVSREIFQPIADALSAALDVAVRYEHPSNWPVYIRNMQQSRYDLLFDSAHFVSWRLEKIEHRPMVKLAGEVQYVIYRSNRQNDVNELKDLRGNRVCANPIPALDALLTLDQFADPWNQPVIAPRYSPQSVHSGLRNNQCEAAVLTLGQYENVADQTATKVLFESPPLSPRAISVSPRLSQQQRSVVRNTLLSAENTEIVAALKSLVGQPVTLETASEDDYRGYSYLLDEFWGF
ncbi:MAG: PhnD/SsuA/transferrin family substrate-binding protein [Pseudomonadota bacterium]